MPDEVKAVERLRASIADSLAVCRREGVPAFSVMLLLDEAEALVAALTRPAQPNGEVVERDDVCANCKGMIGDLASGRDPEELCDTCYRDSVAALTPPSNGEERGEVERLREALSPFADAGEYLALETEGFLPGDKLTLNHNDFEIFDGLQFGHFMNARTALAATGQEREA